MYATYTKHPFWSTLWRTLKTLAGFPFALVFAIASLPAWAVGEKLAAGVEDRTFQNSFRCCAIMFIWTLMLIIWTVVLFCTVKWYWALAAVVVLIPAPMLMYDWVELLRRCASSWRYLFNGRLRDMKNDLMMQLKTI